MKFFTIYIIGILHLISLSAMATESKMMDISKIISEQEFSSYKDVGEFIDQSPKVTIFVQPQESDIANYGESVVKSLTGSDCNRDGVMDDNQTCNAVYFKLWVKYKR